VPEVGVSFSSPLSVTLPESMCIVALKASFGSTSER
jgi:hypothetical protein